MHLLAALAGDSKDTLPRATSLPRKAPAAPAYLVLVSHTTAYFLWPITFLYKVFFLNYVPLVLNKH